MQFNLTLVNERISKKLLVSIILKGLPKEIDNFETLVKYSKDEKFLEEFKQDLIKFDIENVKTETESVIFNNARKCFNCQKMGHIAKDSRPKQTFLKLRLKHFTKASTVKCFKCGEQGHVTKFCRKHKKPEKKILNRSRRTTQRGSQNLFEEQNLEAE